MINTKEGKDKRAREYEQRGFVLGTERSLLEPYITWDQMVLAMLRAQASGKQIHEAIENSLQLSEDPGIFNGREDKK